MNRVIASAYVAALDISFRRSGGLIVILHNRRNIRNIVRAGDAVADQKSEAADIDFDSLISGKKIQSIPTRVVVELASLDGAVVVSNVGEILAYGAILDPKRSGRVRASEGSRTKAATGASNYGLAFKVSSDGGIQIFYKGSSFIEVSKS
jgi:DNA integrity scanning protein DisA with diadenylate cyclase activity